METLTWPLGAMFALGAFHGINPGMGWLFAVALGMQEGRGRAVWRALLPLALGHALAIAAVVLAALALGVAVPRGPLQWTLGVVLIALGVRRLFRCRHPRYGGMRVGARDLTIWSALMATAHGAGLMVLPLVLGIGSTAAAGTDDAHAAHAHHVHGTTMATAASPGLDVASALIATCVHGAGYLAVTALIAWLVYRYAGLGILRRAWVNLDLVWALALVVTGGVALAL
jgi:hypothetical protein